MSSTVPRAFTAAALLLAPLAGCAPGEAPPPLAPGAPPAPPSVSDGAFSGANADWSAIAQASIAAGEYAPQPDGVGLRITNRSQDLRGVFGESGLTVTSRAGVGEVKLSLRAWGREDALEPAAAVPPEEGDCLAGGAVDAFGDCLRRVRYARPGLEEWWENRPEGLEQGFTVTAPPGGDGALVFDLALSGARVDIAGDEATFTRDAGERLRFGALAAWDEAGRSLPAWMEETDDGLRILVDDDGAVGTVTVDPLLTTVAWSAESNQASAYFGWDAASAGDVNADGYGDVVVGAIYYDNGSTDEGRIYLYLGSSAGLSTTAAWTAESNMTAGSLGSAVATAGDVNGDGYGDVIAGAYRYTSGQTHEGAAYVFLGSATGLGTSAAWIAEANQAYAYLGEAVASAGDVNGDGYGDVIIGAHSYDNGESNEGRAWVYLGSATGLSSTAAWTTESNQASAYTGVAVASAGDVNGDGYSDVIVGAYYYDNGEGDEGRASVFLGSATGLATTAAWTGEPNVGSARYGQSVSSAGDVNGDGYSDVIVGANTLTNGETREGRAYVYLGSATGLAAAAAWTAESDMSNAYFGFAVSTAGDVNGDGYADVSVGGPYGGIVNVYLGGETGLSTTADWAAAESATTRYGHAAASAGDVNGDGFGDLIVGVANYTNGASGEGAAFVYLGSSSGLGTTAGWSAGGDQPASGFGYSTASAGDVNGDGYGDVVVGAYSYDNGSTDEGRAFVYLGSSSGLATSAAWSAESDQTDAQFGYAVASAGDIDADGYGDLVVGARQGGGAAGGAAYLFHGSAAGLASAAAWTAESDQAAASFGGSVGAAGDVDGDGYGDLVVGAGAYDDGEPDEGKVYLYLGAASGLATTEAWTAAGEQAYAFFGGAVASAGDVNGDGFGDIVVGARAFDNGQTDEGRAFLYLGSSSGIGAAAAWTAESDQDAASFGGAVAAAGDVNGDGYGDVVVGAPGYDNGQTDEGRAYVYLGAAAGLASTSAWTAESDQAGAYFGSAVASAGNVNGDTYGDVAVGAYAYDNGATDEGRAYVYLGSSSGLGTTDGWAAESDQAGAYFGRAVGSAGDVNGDGYGDLLVGADGYDETGADVGRVSLYFGNADDGTTPVALAPQARQTGTITPIAPGGASGSSAGFDVAITRARGAWGSGRVKIQVEAQPLGTAFSGSTLSSASTYTSSGVAGATVQQSLTGLSGGTGYHWRARVFASPADGQPQGWGPWLYGGQSGDAVGAHVYTRGTTVYIDTDGDGYGSPASTLVLRAGVPTPAGYSTVSTDCDDGDAALHPSATEVCDAANTDEDCDGLVDDADASVSASGKTTYYRDADADGHGGTTTGSYCDLPSGYTATSTDCNDANASIRPGGTEVCDTSNTDEDCDGTADDADASVSASGKTTYYRDVDADGHGGATTGSYCDLPSGYTATSTDCDDANASIRPGGTEVCDTSNTDEDCDGTADDADASVSASGKTTYY